MKRYIKSATSTTKRISLGQYIKDYLNQNYGYTTHDTWTYLGRAHKSGTNIAKLYYLGVPISDISKAVDEAVASIPPVAEILDAYPNLYTVDIFDEGIVTPFSNKPSTEGVLVQVVPNFTFYIDRKTGEVTETNV